MLNILNLNYLNKCRTQNTKEVSIHSRGEEEKEKKEEKKKKDNNNKKNNKEEATKKK